MRLADYALLADENIHPDVVLFLRALDFDVVHVEEDPKLAGKPDLELMQFAYVARRAILTHDSDFGALAFVDGQPFHLILYLRPGHFDPQFTIETLTRLLATDMDVPAGTLLVAIRRNDTVSIRTRRVTPTSPP